MDDPWGSSPWTTTDDAGASPTAKPAPSLDLEPPPRAFLTTAAPSIGVPALSYSPWGQDDGDDWSAVVGPDLGGATAGSLSAWNSGWNGDAAIATAVSAASSKQRSRENSLAARPHSGSISKTASPISSPSRALSRSNSSAAIRLPSISLDPWASEPSSSSHPQPPSSPPRAAQLPEPAVIESIKLEPAADTAPVPRLTADFDPGWDQVEVEAEAEVEASRPGLVTAEDPARTEATRDATAEHGGSDEIRVRKRRSRVSSMCSNVEDDYDYDDDDDDANSRVGDTRQPQDSPITSIDEESRPRPLLKTRASAQPVIQRKISSSKVMNMVVLFDGLAKRATSEPPELERGARASSADPAGENTRPFTPPDRTPRKSGRDTPSEHTPLPDTQGKDDDGRAGEDGAEESAGRRGGRQRSVSGTPTPKMRLRSSVSRGRSSSLVTSMPRPPPPNRTDFGAVKSKFGPVQFVPDLGKVDAIFAKAKLGPVPDVADGYVPDTVLRDCFTDISERRVWSRVSRFGSSRLHNAGGGGFGADDMDDGAYRRVAWPTSEVRAETIKTVRRWMEEGSFLMGGRPAFGGGGRGGGAKGTGSMFGWGSATAADKPAMRLDQVFAQRRLKREAAAGKRQSAPPGTMTAGVLPVVPPVVTAAAAPAPPFGTLPVTASAAQPSFGWSSSSPMGAPAAAPLSAVAPSTRPVSMFASSSPSLSRDRPASLDGLPSSSAAPVPGDASGGDNDDDWGEMIASPAPDGQAGDPSFGLFQAWPDQTEASQAQTVAALARTTQGEASEPVAPTLIQQPPSAPAPSGGSAAVAADPWDLSFFAPPDAAAPPQPHAAKPAPAALSLVTDMDRQAPAAAMPLGAQSSGTWADAHRQQQPAASHLAPPVSSDAVLESPASPDDDDGTVRLIVDGLPNLSYMLR